MQALLAGLEAMPEFLADRFGDLSAEAARRGGPDGTFSPVEQCWHLADLESEGFGARIRLLLREERPFLPDFDGARVARERDYRARSLAEALRAFRAARESNVALLRSLPEEACSRGGVQEGVGEVVLSDIPRLMHEHDASHRAEIIAWCQAGQGTRPFVRPRSSSHEWSGATGSGATTRSAPSSSHCASGRLIRKASAASSASICRTHSRPHAFSQSATIKS